MRVQLCACLYVCVLVFVCVCVCMSYIYINKLFCFIYSIVSRRCVRSGEVADLTPCSLFVYALNGEVANLTKLTRAACSCIYAVLLKRCQLQQDVRRTVYETCFVKSALDAELTEYLTL